MLNFNRDLEEVGSALENGSLMGIGRVWGMSEIPRYKIGLEEFLQIFRTK